MTTGLRRRKLPHEPRITGRTKEARPVLPPEERRRSHTAGLLIGLVLAAAVITVSWYFRG